MPGCCSSACARKPLLDERIQSLRNKVNARQEIRNDLVGDPAFSDFQIRAQGVTFYVVKYQLALKSKVFKDLFKSNSNEVLQGVLELHDDPDAVKAVLDYIFLYKKVEGCELAAKALQLAHRGEMIELKEQCELELLDHLTLRDAPYVLELARSYGLSILFAKCVEFLFYNFEEFEVFEPEIHPAPLARPQPGEARPAPPAGPPPVRENQRPQPVFEPHARRMMDPFQDAEGLAAAYDHFEIQFLPQEEARRQAYVDLNNPEGEQINEPQDESDIFEDLRGENVQGLDELGPEEEAENDESEEEEDGNENEQAYSPEDLLVAALVEGIDQNEKDKIAEEINDDNKEVSDGPNHSGFREHLKKVEENAELDADHDKEQFSGECIENEEQKEGILCRSMEELHIDDSLKEKTENDGKQDDESDSGEAADFEDEDEEETPPTSPLTDKFEENQVLDSQNQAQNQDKTLEAVDEDRTPYVSLCNLPSPPVKGDDKENIEEKTDDQEYGDFFTFNGEKVKVSPVRFAKVESVRPRALVFPDTTEESQTHSEQDASEEIPPVLEDEKEGEHSDDEKATPFVRQIRERYDNPATNFRTDEEGLDSSPDDIEEEFLRFYEGNFPDENEASAIEGDEMYANIDKWNLVEMTFEEYQKYSDWKERKDQQMKSKTPKTAFAGLYKSKTSRKSKPKPSNARPVEQPQPKVEANNVKASAASMFAPAPDASAQASTSSRFAPAPVHPGQASTSCRFAPAPVAPTQASTSSSFAPLTVDPDKAPPLLTASRRGQSIVKSRLSGFSVKNQNTYPLVYQLYRTNNNPSQFYIIQPTRSQSVITDEGTIFFANAVSNKRFESEGEQEPEKEDRFFNNPTFSDFRIKAGSETFYTTKHQLALQSEVFARMFESKMKEATEGVLELPDDPEAVEAMLKHISMYKKVEGGQLARKVLQIAHRYELSELKDQCELEIIDKLSAEDVRESFRVADQLELPLLLLKCCEFIYYGSQTDNTKTEVVDFTVSRHQNGIEYNVTNNSDVTVGARQEKIKQKRSSNEKFLAFCLISKTIFCDKDSLITR
ncbi:unnamed protein product [Bursaphelenchus xylophilus]|uniref:(pine wood nematode) hypothetical protein n=1 Tax=Bursaphelenchus xylophilus TaxID=6326 RepID=A0A811JXL4_BURXY|nr:unnamed protein product [Bursaphelenchus xylophilus]CAG9080087.1 unnamed protein product [Bursaphelenchus xylophilus]